MDDMELPFSNALVGGGEVVCDIAELAPSWAPLIESDVLGLVIDTAGHRPSSMFSPALPHMITKIDTQPHEVQQTLIAQAADRFAGHNDAVANSYFIAAIPRSPHHNSQTDPAPAINTSGRITTPRLPGRSHHRS